MLGGICREGQVGDEGVASLVLEGATPVAAVVVVVRWTAASAEGDAARVHVRPGWRPRKSRFWQQKAGEMPWRKQQGRKSKQESPLQRGPPITI